MSVDYSKSTENREAFMRNLFPKFTDGKSVGLFEFTEYLYNKFTVEDFGYHDDFVYHCMYAYFEEKVIPHKNAVYWAGINLLKAPWIDEFKFDKDEFRRNLWKHDISKFSANEAFGYYSYRFGQDNPPHLKAAFESAWHHHKMNNPHHPEYWINPNRSGGIEILPMPTIYVFEMIADWVGAGKTYGSTLYQWLPDNIGKFLFHVDTARLLIKILGKMDIKVELSGVSESQAGLSFVSIKEDVHIEPLLRPVDQWGLDD